MLHSQYVENCTKICLQSVIVEWRNSLSVQLTQFCFLLFLLYCICVDKINIHSIFIHTVEIYDCLESHGRPGGLYQSNSSIKVKYVTVSK